MHNRLGIVLGAVELAAFHDRGDLRLNINLSGVGMMKREHWSMLVQQPEHMTQLVFGLLHNVIKTTQEATSTRLSATLAPKFVVGVLRDLTVKASLPIFDQKLLSPFHCWAMRISALSISVVRSNLMPIGASTNQQQPRKAN